MKLGIISDTHGFLDPRISKIFAGVDHILHAGDVGDAFIPFELEQIAPVTVVLGNTDLGLTYKLTEVVELGARKFLVQHIVHPPAPDDKLKSRLARSRPDVVVFGHTHKPKFGTERSVAIFHCDETGIQHEFISLGI